MSLREFHVHTDVNLTGFMCISAWKANINVKN